jgi:hypothetical protein
MRERQSAYIKIIGQYWARKAKYQKYARERDAMSNLMSMVRRRLTTDGEVPPSAQVQGAVAEVVEVEEEDEEEEDEDLMVKQDKRNLVASTSTASNSKGSKKTSSPRKAPGLNTIKEDGPLGQVGVPSHPGTLPRYRLLMTLPEIKAVMQLGVAETPSYKGFLLAAGEAGGNLQDMISKELLSRQRNASSGIVEEEMSFTLALLLHRWDSECTPKLTACIRRRFEISKTELSTAFAEGLWLPPPDMAAKLMELRNG